MDLSRTCSTNCKLEDIQEVSTENEGEKTQILLNELDQGDNKSGPWLKPQQH